MIQKILIVVSFGYLQAYRGGEESLHSPDHQVSPLSPS